VLNNCSIAVVEDADGRFVPGLSVHVDVELVMQLSQLRGLAATRPDQAYSLRA
jgi:hypothetical protein